MYNQQNSYGMISPELKLVLLCSNLKLSERDQEVVGKLLACHIDWKLFLHLTVHHRVYPMVYQCLRSFVNLAVPCEVISVLQKETRKNASQTLQMASELVKVLRSMEQNGIHTVVLKGLPLAQQLYGDLALRPCRDMDILVRRDQIEEAIAVVRQCGYHLTDPNILLTPGKLEAWMKVSDQFCFWHEKKEICVELHWRIDNEGIGMPFSFIEDNLTNVQIAGQTIKTLGLEELLVYLVVHGAGHAWFRLRWLFDIDKLIRLGGISWDRVYRLARELHIEKMLNQTVILAQSLLKTPVTDKMMRIAKADRQAQELAGMALRFITAANYSPGNLKQSLFLYCFMKRYNLSLRSGWKRKFAHIHSFLWTLDSRIQSAVLPDYLRMAFYAIRPVTWVYRRLSDIAGR